MTTIEGNRWPDAPPERIVAFQGMLGAYSHLACRERLPEIDMLSIAGRLAQILDLPYGKD